MTQKSLFETSNHDGNQTFVAPSRATDKQTSHIAAANVNLTGNRKLFFETLEAWANIPRTAYEVAARAFPIVGSMPVQSVFKSRETLRKRAGELVKLGLIEECQPRECKVNCNEATTYQVVK